MSLRSQRITQLAVLAVSLAVAFVSTARADILHVPGDFPTIQEAIDAAMNGDEVEVHPGTFCETINFLGKAIRVYSTDGPDVTIIDAQGTGTVVTCDSGEGPETVLEGFTITGGDANFGGGMRNINSSPTVTGCIFIGNTAGAGGALFIQNSSPTIIGCTFRGNCAQVSDGGAMYNLYGNPALVNCLMNGNCAAAFGGGIFSDLAALSLVNCTLSDNTAYLGGGITNYAGVEMTLSSCIIWGNHATTGRGLEVQILSTSSVEVVNYSCVQDLGGAYGGDGNIEADPLFVAPGMGDYHISAGSPCIDAADNTAPGLIGITEDLDSNPRFVDDPDTEDTGLGDPPIVDMGSYEFQTTTTTIPDSYSAFRGFYDSGDLDSLLESDDDKLCYEPGIVLNPTEAPVTLDFFGTLPNDSPSTLDVTIESSANTVGLGLTFSFWNYNTNSWDVVGTAVQSLNDDTIRTFSGVPADHVEPGTGEVRTRYEVRVVSFIFLFPWTDCVDHVFWTVSN